MESGPIRRFVTRSRDVLHDLVVAKELWVGLPAALVLLTSVFAVVRRWFEAQLLVGQFTFVVGMLLFLALGITGVVRAVLREWNTLNVSVGVGQVEVHPGIGEYTNAFVGLRDVTMTTREHRGLSVELLAAWRLEDGREQRVEPGIGRKHWPLNNHEPTITDKDVRFLLGYSVAELSDPSLKAMAKAALSKAMPYLVIRDRVSGKERRIPLQDGQAIADT